MPTGFGQVGQQTKMSCHQIPGIIRSIECASVKLDNLAYHTSISLVSSTMEDYGPKMWW